MARIKVAHMRQLMDELHREKISFSRMVEKLNEIAEFEGICKGGCGKVLETHKENERGICTSCYTGNA